MKNFKRSIAAVAVVSALGVSAPVLAAEDEAKSIEKISVTGSRIKRADLESSSPVQITSAEDIEISGLTRVEDMLNTLPQIEASTTAFESNGASGAGGLDLRGLGTQRTLVLVNGRRMQPGGGSSGSADVNNIPGALVKRVEVMTGGGSSVYGADAVAGVVNFVMDDAFEGFRLDFTTGGYQHNNDDSYIQGLLDDKGFEYPEGQSDIGGNNYGIELTMGGAFADGKGHAVAYATWHRNDELKYGSRDYTSCALNATATSCGGSGNAVNPNFYIGTLDAEGGYDDTNEQYVTLSEDSAFIDSENNLYNYNPVNFFLRPDERYSIGSFANYEINDNFQPYLEFMYMRDQTKAQIAESGTFFNEAYTIDYDSDLLNDVQRQYLTDELGLSSGDQFSTYIGKRNVEGGARASIIQHDSFRIVLGSEGEINDGWYYDASIQVGSTTVDNIYINDFYAPRITTALSANGESCADDADCIPYEVFTYDGISTEAAGLLTGTASMVELSDQFIFSAFASGELDLNMPGADSPVAIVVGTEYRDEQYERIVDEVYDKGLLLGQGGPTHGLVGGYTVKELYTEVNIPVLEGVAFAESLYVDLGYRYSDYDLSGAEPTYKVALDWTPIEGWKVRASYNRAARAANIGELFSSQSLGLWSGSDPCSTNDEGVTEFTAAECANTGVTAEQYGNVSESPAAQYNGLFGGNTQLSPEIADTISVGVVGQITDEIDFSIDYWSISIDDVIGTISEDVTLEQCAKTGNSAYCDNIVRNSSGNLWRGQEGYIQATNINLASRFWEGVDVSGAFNTEVAGNPLSVSILGTYMLSKEYEPLPGDKDAIYDCVGTISAKCFPQPEWRHVVNMNYAIDDLSINAKWRFLGEVENTDYGYDETTGEPLETNDVLAGKAISAQSYIDVSVSYSLTENIITRVGVNNILDEAPPITGSTLDSGAYYDQLGRYLNASVSLKF